MGIASYATFFTSCFGHFQASDQSTQLFGETDKRVVDNIIVCANAGFNSFGSNIDYAVIPATQSDCERFLPT